MQEITNEKLKKKFKSQFNLVNYAIKIADRRIKSGSESRIRADNQNLALSVLSEITTENLEDLR